MKIIQLLILFIAFSHQGKAALINCPKGETRAEALKIVENDYCQHGFAGITDKGSEFCLATDEYVAPLNTPLQACYEIEGSTQFGAQMRISWALNANYESLNIN